MLAARRGWSVLLALPLEQVRRIWVRLEEMRRAIETRRILARLDEQTLADIGVTRAEVLEEIRRMPWDTKPRR